MRVLFACALALSLSRAAPAQVEDDDKPLLPDTISEQDVEMSGRYARQWRQEDGTLVVVYTGAFKLSMGARTLSAHNAVVWIYPKRSEPENRRYYELVVYLSEDAEVREAAGTVTEDRRLLVRNLRTFGRIVKYQDAHSTAPAEDTELYRFAEQDRRRIEAEQESGLAVQVSRPPDLAPKKPQRRIRFRIERTEPAQTPDGETVQVATGGVYFSATGNADAGVLEISAQNAVIFLEPRGAAKFLAGAAGEGAAGEGAASRPASQPTTEPAGGADSRKSAPPEQPQEKGAAGLPKDLPIRAVYLEGDVILTLGERVVRASRLYYDFERDRALILDAVFHTPVPGRNVPLYVRADEIRQLSAREFSADNARVTTSEFYTPHYFVGAEKVYIRDLTPRGNDGGALTAVRGEAELHNATLNVENIPILWWPYAKGALDTSETTLRGFRTGWSDDFGAEVETSWYLFNLLGITPPPGFDATLKLDYFSARGPAIGVNGKYEQQDYYGYTKNYFIHDDGEDHLGPVQDNTPSTDERGRTLWRHRSFLPNDWELTLEVAYASDPGFLEEYEKSEWFEDKQQETVFYLKRAKEIDAITLLANWRLLDFTTQTEHLPDLTYRRIGDMLGPFVFYNEERVGGVRYRPDDRHFLDNRRYTNTGETDVTFRTDVREEAELPLKMTGLNIVPFGSIRGTYWDGQPLESGGLWRGLGLYGVRGSMYLSRVYDGVKSELFDVNRIRHIIQPDFAVWGASSNTRSENITPFDEGVELIDAIYGGMVGLRNTWQTKRGTGDKQKTVDLLAINLEAGFFGGDTPDNADSNGYADPIRPESSRPRNYFAGEALYRLSDTTTLQYDFNLDLNDLSYDRNDLSVAIERSPRLAYVLGYRHAGDINLDLVGGGFNYRFNEKHTLAFRTWIDTDRGELGELTVSYVRKLPRWYFALTFEMDQVFDDLSVSVSLWPEGIPEWTLGSRRFSQLGQSTEIRPDGKPAGP